MAIGRITYADKVDYQEQGQDSQYKITAKDMNEIKSVFNNSADSIEEGLSKLATAVAQASASMENAKASEVNAKAYMESAQASAESVLNGLGLKIIDGYLCMEGDD